MKIAHLTLLLAISINLIACSSMAGNVIPNKGPTMEKMYDNMGENKISANKNVNTINNSRLEEADLSAIRQRDISTLNGSVNRYAVSQQFHKLPNPELPLYIFPHLAGQDQIPVPGYYTVFNVYTHDYYALPQEMTRG